MKNAFAVVAMILASSLTSVALAQKTDASKYADSEFGTVTPGVIKFLRDCPLGTDAFFKNVNPFISGGSGGFDGEFEWQDTFLIDGTDVTLFVYWKDDNSFRFEVQNGVMQEIGAEVDSDKLVYEYQAGPVFRDGTLDTGRLNVLESGGDSAAVNHLDICLSLVDTTPPVIEFVTPEDTTPPTPPTQVSGTVTVIVTVTDPSGVDPSSVILSVNDGLTTDEPMTCTPLSQTQYQCDYEWDTKPLPVGLYDITVSASDEAIPDNNTRTEIATVEVVKLLSDCFGILGDEDFDEDPTEPVTGYTGCEPTPLVNVQAPPDTDVCNVDDPDPVCFLSGELYKPKSDAYIEGLGCHACTPGYCGDYGLPDTRMICSTETFNQDGSCTGDWVPDTTDLRPLIIADVAEGGPPGVLGKYVYGYKGCFTAARHFRGGISIKELYPEWPQDDPDTPNVDEATGLVFVKKHSPEKLLQNVDLVAPCAVGTQNAAQAGYQPIGKEDSVDTLDDGAGTQAITLAATQKCNAPRSLSRDNGIDVSNIIETDGSDDSGAFKYQMAQMQFDALFVALDCAEPTFNRRGQSKFSNVSSPINQAKAQFDNGTIAALERARDDLRDAAAAIRTSDWDVTLENCAGDALARTENLAWRMTDLICAQTTPGTGECAASPYP